MLMQIRDVLFAGHQKAGYCICRILRKVINTFQEIIIFRKIKCPVDHIGSYFIRRIALEMMLCDVCILFQDVMHSRRKEAVV